jgi:hypothetical protein
MLDTLFKLQGSWLLSYLLCIEINLGNITNTTQPYGISLKHILKNIFYFVTLRLNESIPLILTEFDNVESVGITGKEPKT